MHTGTRCSIAGGRRKRPLRRPGKRPAFLARRRYNVAITLVSNVLNTFQVICRFMGWLDKARFEINLAGQAVCLCACVSVYGRKKWLKVGHLNNRIPTSLCVRDSCIRFTMISYGNRWNIAEKICLPNGNLFRNLPYVKTINQTVVYQFFRQTNPMSFDLIIQKFVEVTMGSKNPKYLTYQTS